ncbi:MAG: NAD-dependent malic enzyme [Chloroflexi bacterium]|nr:NAD-dependent malic enzyme [Chloroflexota bacterium]MCL5107860.1 NAD-dependent malic enzyme [Chloroflexota bacterium]
MTHPSASYSVTLRCEIQNHPGMLGRVMSAIGEEGGDIGAVDMVTVNAKVVVRDIVVDTCGEAHGEAIARRVSLIDGVRVLSWSDRTFRVHEGGKIALAPRVPVKTRDDLSMVYTPGVGRVCQAIAADPSRVYSLTAKGNMVAVVTDGSAVLGLGNIGPEASLPVMEGKCVLFKELAGVDAFPIALATQDVERIVDAVAALATGFGGINLEDIASPRCFAVEPRLQELLDIPVFHDDQHGTAVVIMAGLLNALKLVGKPISEVKVVVAGAGAAGVATVRILRSAGAKQIICCDRQGALYAGRPGMNAFKEEVAAGTNPDRLRGGVAEVLRGADVFVGVSSPDLIGAAEVQTMAKEPIVFALANPVPEVQPEEIEGLAAVIATGRSDYPNQINNALAFPGIFRGALDCRARRINEAMKRAAAEAIAGCIAGEELSAEHVVPGIFSKRVVADVAAAVRQAAQASGVARLE